MFWEARGRPRGSGRKRRKLPYRDPFAHPRRRLPGEPGQHHRRRQRAGRGPPGHLAGGSDWQAAVGYLGRANGCGHRGRSRRVAASGSISAAFSCSQCRAISSRRDHPSRSRHRGADTVLPGQMRDRTQEEKLERDAPATWPLLRGRRPAARGPRRCASSAGDHRRQLGRGSVPCDIDGGGWFLQRRRTNTPEAVRATLAASIPARSPARRCCQGFERHRSHGPGRSSFAPLGRTGKGPRTVRPASDTALVRDRRIGAWSCSGPGIRRPLSITARLELTGRYVGLAIGSVATRLKVQRDAELRESLADRPVSAVWSSSR